MVDGPQLITESAQGLKCEKFMYFSYLIRWKFDDPRGEIGPFDEHRIQRNPQLSFSAKRRKSLWDAANHVQHAVWKWFPVPSAASLQQQSRFTEATTSAWKIQNRQLNQNSP